MLLWVRDSDGNVNVQLVASQIVQITLPSICIEEKVQQNLVNLVI